MELNEIAGVRVDPDRLEDLSLEEMTRVYNAVTGEAIGRFRDKATGQHRLREAWHGRVETTGNNTDVPSVETAAPTPAKRKRSAAPDSGVITVIVTTNPKRGKARERFDRYRPGMTVAAAKEAGLSRDIPHDVAHGFIRIETPSAGTSKAALPPPENSPDTLVASGPST